MNDSPPPSAHRSAPWTRSTAARIFLVLMLALLPLAVGASIANIFSLRSAERDKITLMQTATRQNASQIAANLDVIHSTQILATGVYAKNPASATICARMQALLQAVAGARGIESVLYAPANGRILCASPGAARLIRAAGVGGFGPSGVRIDPDLDGVLMRSASPDGALVALSLYRRPALQRLTRASDQGPAHSIHLHQQGRVLPLAGPPPGNDHGSVLATRAAVGSHGLSLHLAMEKALPFGARTLSLLMPLLLWLAATFLGWLVMRWILVRPLIALRREVAAYRPGAIIVPPQTNRLVSDEIVALGDAFRAMSEDVAEHEDEMRIALERQTRLTREVHHRVKNNLQIISSLISLHWRAARDSEAGNAYLSIQRRVDALAVVQRNHYAELDGQQGVRARPMLNEIVSGLKISAQVQSGRTLDIAIACDDVCLHQDVAAPVAFMTAELADMVITADGEQSLALSLVRLDPEEENGGEATGSAASGPQALFALSSPAFRKEEATPATGEPPANLHERILTGLARQLRTPLEHDPATGDYHVRIPILAQCPVPAA